MKPPETIRRELHLLHMMIETLVPEGERGEAWEDLLIFFLHTPTDTPLREAFEMFIKTYKFHESIFKDLY